MFTLVERDGAARSFHVPNVTAKTLRPIIVSVASRKSHFRTDESGVFWAIGEEFKTHRTVNHAAEEYVRGDAPYYTAEGYFSILKRGISWRLSPRLRRSPSPLPRRIRFPLFEPREARH